MAELTKDYHDGATWMLGAILGSLKGYPHLGGDINIMKEVERIEREAWQRGYDAGIDDGIGNQG